MGRSSNKAPIDPACSNPAFRHSLLKSEACVVSEASQRGRAHRGLSADHRRRGPGAGRTSPVAKRDVYSRASVSGCQILNAIRTSPYPPSCQKPIEGSDGCPSDCSTGAPGPSRRSFPFASAFASVEQRRWTSWARRHAARQHAWGRNVAKLKPQHVVSRPFKVGEPRRASSDYQRIFSPVVNLATDRFGWLTGALHRSCQGREVSL